jgi:hypothetical protein
MERTIMVEIRDKDGDLRAKARSRNGQGAEWRVFYFPQGAPKKPVLACPNLQVHNGATSVVDYMLTMVQLCDQKGDTTPSEG